jgi:hypothetical protein
MICLGLACCATLTFDSWAGDSAELPTPTMENEPYGPHERNVFDFWKSDAATPAPLLLVIHGGGFHEGDKMGFARDHRGGILQCMNGGMAVAVINYRFIPSASLPEIFRDSARALQHIRSRAAELNVDKNKVIALGESAGAGMALWLGMHDDLADPANPDPILRESTRLSAVATLVPQATYDFAAWPEVLGVTDLVWVFSAWSISGAYYHCSPLGVYTEKGRKMRADLDIRSLITPDDPPLYINCYVPEVDLRVGNFARWIYEQATKDGAIPALGKPKGPLLNLDILHHPNHVRVLESACKRQNVPCSITSRETPEEKRKDIYEFVLEHAK